MKITKSRLKQIIKEEIEDELKYKDSLLRIFKGGNHQQAFELANVVGMQDFLVDADLVYADLGGANLKDVNLAGAILFGANLNNANLEGANLKGADLSLADLVGANLKGADLTDATLHVTNLTDADLTDAIGAEEFKTLQYDA